MKKLHFIFILIFSTLFSKAQDNALLYEISGNGLEKPSYLFGTFHLLCKDNFTLSPLFLEKFESTSQLALEIDMDDPKMMMKMMGLMAMKNDTALNTLLDKNDFSVLEEYFKDSVGMPIIMFAKAKPMLLFSMMLPKKLNCELITFENELVKIAKNQNKEVLGLETLEHQMGVFDKIPYTIQANYLMDFIKDSEKSMDELNSLMKYYLDKDLKSLTEKMNEDENDFKKYERFLLTDRNHNWIPVIENMAKEKSTFFAFGAGHLSGENGVLNLLKAKGFTITAID
jgi:uncharacterized protein YbaP (TraB family)